MKMLLVRMALIVPLDLKLKEQDVFETKLDSSYRRTRAAKAGNIVEADRIIHAFDTLWVFFREFRIFWVMFTILEVLGLGNITPSRPILPLDQACRRRVEVALSPLLQAISDPVGCSFSLSPSRERGSLVIRSSAGSVLEGLKHFTIIFSAALTSHNDYESS